MRTLGILLLLSVVGTGCESCKPTCPGEVGIELLQEAVSPDGRYVARRYQESGGGAAGSFDVALNIQDAKEKFQWCRAVVARSKMCLRAHGSLSWSDAHTLMAGCAEGWETDSYYTDQRHAMLGNVVIKYLSE